MRREDERVVLPTHGQPGAFYPDATLLPYLGEAQRVAKVDPVALGGLGVVGLESVCCL